MARQSDPTEMKVAKAFIKGLDTLSFNPFYFAATLRLAPAAVQRRFINIFLAYLDTAIEIDRQGIPITQEEHVLTQHLKIIHNAIPMDRAFFEY